MAERLQHERTFIDVRSMDARRLKDGHEMGLRTCFRAISRAQRHIHDWIRGS